jgi:predicted nuclease with TOPRIM domain
MQAEREVLQQQVEKQMSQLAQANNKIDDLRRKADSTQVSVNRNLVEKVKSLEEQLSECERAKELTSNKVTRKSCFIIILLIPNMLSNISVLHILAH